MWLVKRVVVLEELQAQGVRPEVGMAGEVTERAELRLVGVSVVQVITVAEVEVEVGMGAVAVAGIVI